jgi:hypothetical protein
VQTLGIVQAQETAGKTAIRRKPCRNGGDMTTGSLDSAGRKHLCE